MDNSFIIFPKNYHIYSLILLHGMTSNINSFNKFIYHFSNHKLYGKFFYNTKIIIPYSPILDIHFPNNCIKNVNSWYDYYTQYDGQFEIDNISIEQFDEQSRRIKNIILDESKIINKKNIFLLGVSQGGTLIFNILNLLNFTIGGIIGIDTIYMHKYINLQKSLTPIFIYSHYYDEIYPYKFQINCLSIIENKCNIKKKIY